jgi:hypothetical protein
MATHVDRIRMKYEVMSLVLDERQLRLWASRLRFPSRTIEAPLERIGQSMRLFRSANAAWAWQEPKRLTEGVQGV